MNAIDREYLIDILDRIHKIERVVARGQEAFFADDELQTIAEHHVAIIGEIVKHLSPEVREADNTIPWKNIAGMRDVIIHGYRTVQVEWVWSTIIQSVPVLKVFVEKLLTD